MRHRSRQDRNYDAGMALTDGELLRRLAEDESDLVERKESAADKDKICEAICAFANDLPGYGKPGVIFVGVDDRGRPTGLAVTDALLQSLGAIRSDGNILPPPTLVVRKVRAGAADVAAVEVQPSTSPPVRYRGRVWIRVGPRRAVATADEERRLNEKRRSADTPFDARPLAGTSLDELDLTLFERVYMPSALPPDVVAENGRTTEQRLMALRFVGSDHTPTAAGIILLGTDPLAYVPGSYIQFLRFAGTSLTDPIQDQQRLTGTLIDILRQLDELLRLNIAVGTDLSGAVEAQEPDYPLAALQQVARNAVMHRSYEHTNAPIRITWYTDRVEVISPGGPYGIVNVENFGVPGVTDYRNPTLAEAMRAMGYVQRFGIGLGLVRASLARNGHPPPDFEPTATHVGVILRRRP
jgi:ATP-dependent DNA helicase RecG